MSSVYGYYSSSISSSSSSSTSLGISGLVSGLDIDSTVEAMTSGTTSKISKVQQNLMKLQWKQEAYQDVGTSLTDFKSKYLSSSGSSSISSLLSSCYTIEGDGDNASAVSASGSSSILSNFSLLGVSQLASTASYTTSNQITSAALTTGKIDFSEEGSTISTLEGKKLTLKVGSDSYTLEFDDTVITDTESMLTAVNNAIKNYDADQESDLDKIGNKIEASIVDGKLTLTSKSSDYITVGSSSNATLLKTLGLQKVDNSGNSSGSHYLNGQTITGQDPDFSATSKTVAFFDTLSSGDATLTFDLDGEKATLKFDSDMADAIKAAGTAAEEAGEDKDSAMLAEFANQVNSQLSRVYGSKVSATANDDGTLSFATSNSTSVLSVSSGSTGIIGTSGLLGIEVGDANRLLTSKALEESNFKNAFDFGADGENTYDMTINGVSFVIGKNSITVDGETTEYSKGVTMKNVLSAINSSDANVSMSYLSTTDRFTISSTVSGAAGNIEISGSFADMIFGDGGATLDEDTHTYTSNGSGTIGAGLANANGTFIAGKDSKILVSFDGNTVQEVTRSSNSFTLDGLSLNLKKTFNTDYTAADFTSGDKTVENADGKISFTRTVDTEKLSETLTEMVDDYNAIIDKVIDYYKTKSDSDYQPLTSDMIEDEDLTDEQAELYNNKAKEGVLFGDSILRSLSDDLRTIFTGMSSIGITTSSDYSEYGKLTFDAEKFASAMESDPEKVTDYFTNEKTGALTKLDSLMDKYVNSSIASPGLITAKSGLASSSLSQMTSTLYSEMQALEDQLDDLNDKLETQQDRYYSQFTNMEVELNSIMSQSSYLSSLSS
jgi:flagellar hook-associated protein 2